MKSTQKKTGGAQLRQSGQAMVEFSILMLLFVPILLYGFFLSDAAYHQLEVQETVVSTLWDFSQRTAQPGGTETRDNVVDATVRAAHIMYMDHTSSYDEIDPSTVNDATKNDIALANGSGSGTAKHHNQFAAHACFVNYQKQWTRTHGTTAYDGPKSDGASNVACTVDSVADTGWITGGLAASTHLHPAQALGQSSTLAKGGLIYCWARGRIYNYLVPDQFLQDFSHVDLSQGKTDHDTVSTNSMSDDDAKAPHKLNEAATDLNSILIRDKASLSYDTWAGDNGATKMHDARDRDSGARSDDLTSDDDYNPSIGIEQNTYDNLYYDRVAAVYGARPTETGLTSTNATYLALVAGIADFFGNSTPWMIINPAPYLANSTLASVPLPDSAAVVAMAARYTRSTTEADMKTGYLSPCAWRGYAGLAIDSLQCLPNITPSFNLLSKFETTPFERFGDGSNSIPAKMFNARGAYYMGSTDQNTVWSP